MRRYKIATKLFMITSVSLLILLSIQLLFQTLYLEKFYIYNKKASIKKELQVLDKRLEGKTEEEINKELRLFSQGFGATTGIVNLSATPLYGFDIRMAFMEIETEAGITYKVYLNGFVEDAKLTKELKIGEQVQISGSQVNMKEIYPQLIRINGKEFIPPIALESSMAVTAIPESHMNGEAPQEQMAAETVVSQATNIANSFILQLEVDSVDVIGTVKDIYIPGEETFGTAYREGKIIVEMNAFISKASISKVSLEIGKTMIEEIQDPYVGIKNIMGVVPTILNGEYCFIVSMTSLQQVEEAINIMNQYAFIIFVLALAIAISLAYWYSKKITKPLVVLKDITTSITNLDFTKTCDLQSKDEIGELAININVMSDRLKETLDKLQEDMAFKERLDEQRKQFIIDVSHELKTPLTVLKATCEGFIDEVYESQDKSYFQNMLAQIDAMGELVQELIMVSKLENENMLNLEIFNLSDTILKMHAQLKYLAREKYIHIQMELDESLVRGDRKQIETVIRNFYNNAIFYTPKGGYIKVKLQRQEADWCCSIENEGVFIAAEELEKIWEPFYRIDQSRNKELGGSGLGLYIVKKIMDSHGQDREDGIKNYGIENTERGVKAWFILKQAQIE